MTMSTDQMINKAVEAANEGKTVGIRAASRKRAWELVKRASSHPRAPRHYLFRPLGPKEYLTSVATYTGDFDDTVVFDDQETTGDA